MLIHGSCHCGNISFELDWGSAPIEIPARACDCSFCTKHAGVWTSSPKGSLKVSVKHRSLVSEYAFGTRTALFHVCRQCGVVPVVTSEINGRLHAVVSVNAFNNVGQSMLRHPPASLEGETTESRLARREQNWVPDVQFIDSGP